MKLKIGISACLLGEACRYNGDHARDRFVTDVLEKYVTYVSCCPEALLGTPREIMRHVEEEGRLQDPCLKENFLMQIYAYADMQTLLKEAKGMKDLVAFHTNYKYLIYAKSHQSYKSLGAIVANHDKTSFEDVLASYEIAFYKAIAQKSTKANNYNIMQHIYGYFKEKVSAGEKTELLTAMDEFKSGVLPMIVIIKMLRLYIEKYDVTYLKSQVYLKPYPSELGLRSDIKSYK